MHSGALTLINPTWMSRIRMLNSTHTNSIHVILRQNSPCFFLFTAVFIWHASSAFLNRYKPFQIYHTRDIFGNSFHIPQRRSFPTIFFFFNSNPHFPWQHSRISADRFHFFHIFQLIETIPIPNCSSHSGHLENYFFTIQKCPSFFFMAFHIFHDKIENSIIKMCIFLFFFQSTRSISAQGHLFSIHTRFQ